MICSFSFDQTWHMEFACKLLKKNQKSAEKDSALFGAQNCELLKKLDQNFKKKRELIIWHPKFYAR